MRKSLLIIGFVGAGYLLSAQCDKVNDALKSLNLSKYEEAATQISAAEEAIKSASSIENKCLTRFYYVKGSAYLQKARAEKADLATKISYMDKSETAFVNLFSYEGFSKDIEARAKTDLEALANSQKNTAIDYYTNGDLETALKLTEQCIANKNRLSVDKKDLKAYYNAHVISIKMGDNERAVKYADILIGGNYNNAAQVYGNKASAQNNLGQQDSALATLATARSAYPDDANLMIIELQIHRTNGDNAKSLEVLNKLTSIVTDRADLFAIKGEIHSKNKDLELAKEAYNKALQIDTANVNALYGLAVYYVNKGNEYIQNLNRVGNTASDNEAKSGANAEVKKNYMRAINYLDMLLRIDPKDRSSLNTLKQIYNSLLEADKNNAEYKAKIEEINKKLLAE